MNDAKQKFEAWTHSEEARALLMAELPLYPSRLLLQAFEAGMRAGEIAMREKIIKAACMGCRLGWPERGLPAHGIVIHIQPVSGGLYACQSVAIRALPAAPEEKK